MALRSNITNAGFPGIVASYGQPNPPGIASGLARYWGGGEVIYVCNRTGLPSQDGSTPQRPMASIKTAVTALNGSLKRGHVIFALPGHAESVDAADWASGIGAANSVALVALGTGTATPTLTWTIATSTFLMDTDNIAIDGFRLQLEPTTGTVNVAAPITVSAASCAIRNCRILFGTDANNKVTIGITTTAAADDFVFEGNECYGAALATCTTFLRIVGGTRAKIRNNVIVGGTTAAAVGVIQNLTTAATNALIVDNVLQNNAASSTAALTWALAASTGTIARNMCRNMTDGSNAQIVVTSGDMQLFLNYGVNNSNETGIQLGTASA